MKKILKFILVFVLFFNCQNTDEFLYYNQNNNKLPLSVTAVINNDSIYVCIVNNNKCNNENKNDVITTDSTAIITVIEDGKKIGDLTKRETKILLQFYDNFGQIIDTFETKNYYFFDYSVKPNKKYDLLIEPVNELPIKATTIMPALSTVNVILDSVYRPCPDKELNPFNTPCSDSVLFTKINVLISDLQNVNNYYLFELVADYSHIYYRQITSYNLLAEFGYIDTYSYMQTPFYDFMSDKLFDGTGYSFSYEFLKGNAKNIGVNIYQLTPDYFNFMNTIYNYRKNLYDPFSKPVPIYTNITNGLGIFGAYYVTKFSFNI